MLDDAYLWSTNDDAAASILDGDNEVVETTGALICTDCQVPTARKPIVYVREKITPHRETAAA